MNFFHEYAIFILTSRGNKCKPYEFVKVTRLPIFHSSSSLKYLTRNLCASEERGLQNMSF